MLSEISAFTDQKRVLLIRADLVGGGISGKVHGVSGFTGARKSDARITA